MASQRAMITQVTTPSRTTDGCAITEDSKGSRAAIKVNPRINVAQPSEYNITFCVGRKTATELRSRANRRHLGPVLRILPGKQMNDGGAQTLRLWPCLREVRSRRTSFGRHCQAATVAAGGDNVVFKHRRRHRPPREVALQIPAARASTAQTKRRSSLNGPLWSRAAKFRSGRRARRSPAIPLRKPAQSACDARCDRVDQNHPPQLRRASA
jgi:hypothetical protein